MTRTVRQPEVVVVGAGPGGASAALVLARRGRRVQVFEQACFPRAKVCGGCLSGDAIMALEGLIGARVAELGTPVRRIHFHAGRHCFSANDTQRCRIVPRDQLDAVLAEAATQAGACVHFNTRARILEDTGNGLAVEADGDVIHPDWIIWAAGTKGASQERAKAPARRLVGQALTVVPNAVCPAPGEIGMHWLRGGYVGLATLDAEHCLVAWAVEAEILEGRRPWSALRHANPDSRVLADLPVNAGQQAAGTAGFPIRPQCVGMGNLLLAGDAAGFEEPFSGEGIGQALRSGVAAAEAIAAGGEAAAVQQRYARLLADHRRVRRRTRRLSAVLRHRLTRAVLGAPLPLPAELGGRLVARMHIRPSVGGTWS